MAFDIWNSATNTEVVNRMVTTALEDDNLVGPSIAPLVPTNDRRIKRGTIEVEAFGKGKFKARGAAPPIFIPRITMTEEFIELAHLDEMTPIEEDEWHDLTGDNEYAKNKAGVAILQRARILQLRNERNTEWMRWQAFQDNLQVAMADEAGQQYALTYGLPATHKPTASPYWSDRVNSTPVTNLKAWQKLLQKEIGYWGLNIYMGADTYEDLQYSKEIKDLLKPNDSSSSFFIPTKTQVMSLLYGGDQVGEGRNNLQGQVNLTITNAGYRDEGQGTARGSDAMTYYLPEGYVMITTQNTIGGERIADVPDGRVAVTTNGGPPLVWKQGAQS
jgi:Phage major capsid protein E